MLEEFGLPTALQSMVNSLETQPKITSQFAIEGTPRRLKPELEISIYRIAQEAVTNVKKHAGACDCFLVIKYFPDRIQLEIRDTGRGFNLPDSPGNSVYPGQLGLTGMQERTRWIGGKLNIKSHPGKGTTVKLELFDKNATPENVQLKVADFSVL
jgi:signal transduction histidine kinase